jgi:type IV pilus assembly protein PilW
MIELMVGMAIGLIGTVIIAAALVANEDFKRSTVGTSDAQVNGALSLYAIERDLRMAGYGFANTNALGCASVTYSRTSFVGVYPAFGLRPIVMTDGGGTVAGGLQTATAADTLQVVFASEAQRSLPAVFNGNMAASGTSIVLFDTIGYNGSATTRGDLVVAVSGSTCTMHQVTAVANSTTLTVAAGAPFNGTASPGYSTGAYLFNLGLPVVHNYSINANGGLNLLDVFSATASNVAPTVSTTPVTVANGVVDLQADYGIDANGDGIVDTYTLTAPTTAAGWAQVLAIRVAVLVRSANYFKPPTAGGACTATTAAPTWTGGTHYMSDALPSCYKYRSFETTVPLRNMIWKEA